MDRRGMGMDPDDVIETRYAAFLARWGGYVEDGYGEEPTLEDYAQALASVTAADPVTLYRGMAVPPDWGRDLEATTPLGTTWTMDRATALTYAGMPGGGATLVPGHVAVLLEGLVRLADIEIDETVANHLVAGEGEVALAEGARIRLRSVEGLEADARLLGCEFPSVGEDRQPAPR